MDCNRYEKIKEKIERDSKCMPKCAYLLGATGPMGPTGPTGPSGGSTDDTTGCGCINQMRNIIEQIITLYPNSNLFITLSGGDAIIGRAVALISGSTGNPGVLEIANTNLPEQYISLCSIDTIRIDNVTYNDAITYLPTPTPAPTGCQADCEAAIRSIAPVGTTGVSIISNTQISATGTVIRNEYGMIVLEDTVRNNISFVSSCRADIIYSQQ